MTTGDFTAEDWVEHLAQMLTELATIQGRYRDDLDQIEREMSQWKGFDHPSDTLREFYSLACVGKGRYHAGEYALAIDPGTMEVLLAPHTKESEYKKWVAAVFGYRKILRSSHTRKL